MAYSSPEVRACWGFAAGGEALPSLPQLLREAAAKQARHRHSPDLEDSDPDPSYLSQLENSHAFTSNASVAAMAGALGLSHLTTSLAGSLMAAQPVNTAAVTPAAADIAEAAVAAVAGRPMSCSADSPPRCQSNTAGAATKRGRGPSSGSTAVKAAAAAADAARDAVWQQIDGAWAAEAVKRGVAHAKAGKQWGCGHAWWNLQKINCVHG